MSPISAAYEALGHLRDRAAIIDSGWGQAAGQDLALVVDHQMPLEAVEPVHRILATLGQPRKNVMLLETAVMADHQLGIEDTPWLKQWTCRRGLRSGRDGVAEHQIPWGLQTFPTYARLEDSTLVKPWVPSLST